MRIPKVLTMGKHESRIVPYDNFTKNQSFSNAELIWKGYTSFGMNLAEEQDNTYSLANQLAKTGSAGSMRGQSSPIFISFRSPSGRRGSRRSICGIPKEKRS